MPVTITYNFPKEYLRNATIKQAIVNSANFVRDLWLARSPYASGEYAKGLMHAGSIRIGNGKIEITNYSKHSAIVEYGSRSFNIGLAMLRNGRGVRVGKDGNRYKFVKIEPNDRANHRKASVAKSVVASFNKLMPIGMPAPKIDRYGSLKSYKPNKRLQHPIKGKRPSANTPRGVFVVSEKAIRENPNKWQVPAKAGRKLGKQVHQEAKAYVVAAIRKAVAAEKARQARIGKRPQWSLGRKMFGSSVR